MKQISYNGQMNRPDTIPDVRKKALRLLKKIKKPTYRMFVYRVDEGKEKLFCELQGTKKKLSNSKTIFTHSYPNYILKFSEVTKINN